MSRVTLSRYLIEQTRSNNTPADLRFLIEVVARACKEISHAVSKGALGGVLGSMGTENVQGEVQKKLDVISNEILLEANEWGGHLAGMSLRSIALLSFCVLLAACSKVNQENYSKLSAGMAKAEVETLLGKPTDCSGALGMSSCTWGDKNSFISVQYAGDKVLMFSGQGLK